MRGFVFLLAVVLAATALSWHAEASVARLEGTPRAGFGVWFTAPPAPDGTVQVRVDIGGSFDSTAVAEAHIAIPPGLLLVSGDTLIRTPAVGDPGRHFMLAVRPSGTGLQVINGVLIVTGPHLGTEETEVELTMTVSPDTVVLGGCRIVRQECVRGGQRYRYGGEFLVPIPHAERFIEDELMVATGRRPNIARQAVATCSVCPAGTHTTMSWVVFVGADGLVVDARPLDSGADPTVTAAARASLSTWNFTPALVRGLPVSDWVIVQVQVAK